MRTAALFLTASIAFPGVAHAATERPLPAITHTTPETPAGNLSGVSSQSPGDGITYAWDLDGDGAYDDNQPFPEGRTGYQNLDLDAGVHTFGVQATDRFGRVGTERRTFTVHGADLPPSVGFGLYEGRPAWQPFVVPVATTSQWTSIARREADVDGDGSFERFRDDPVARFTSGGGHVIHARVTDAHGLTSTASRTFNVTGPGQTASFTVLPAGGEPGELVAGEPLRIVGEAVDAGPGHYELDLDGNGSYESDQGAATSSTHAFAAGAHTIGLRVTDADGTVAVSRVGVEVAPASNAGGPWVSQSAPGGAVVGQSVQLPAVSGGGDRTVDWDADGDGAFDDGSKSLPANAPGSSISFTYDTPGVYEIRTRVTTAGGAASVVTRTIEVAATAQPVPPALTAFELPWNKPVREGRATRFEIEAEGGVTPSFDLDGDGQFDDVPARHGNTYVWRFDAPVTIAAKVTGANGLTAVSTASVTPVAGIGIQADIALSTPRAGQSLLATSAVRGDTADCCTAQWDLDGDGAYDDATGFDVTLTPGAGALTIGVRVEDEDGAVTTTHRSFTVGGEPPAATISVDETTLTAAAVDPDGEAIASLEWDLDGDGQFDDASGATIPLPGHWRVEVKATDATGDIGVASLTLLDGDLGLAIPPLDPVDARPLAPPPAKATPLVVTASVGQVTLARLLSRGLPVTVRCETACRATATMAKRGAAKLGTASGASRLTVKVSSKARKALRTARSLKLQVAISATTTDGRKGTVTRTLTVRR